MRSESVEILKTLQEMDAAGTLQGCFSDIPIDVYHHPECPGYSSTVLKRIIAQSFNHWFVSKDSAARALEFGSAFHCFVNEPHLFDELFQVIATDSRKSTEWRAAKVAKSDKTLLTSADFECIRVMSKKLYEHPDIAPFMAAAQFEHTYFSRDSRTGLLKKCRTDIKTPGIIWDLKSTIDASTEEFSWDMRKRMQRISSAYYCEIVTEVEGVRHDDFRLIACEKLEPWEINVVKVAQVSLERADEQIRGALATIRRILDEGPSAWKGYQLGVEEIVI